MPRKTHDAEILRAALRESPLERKFAARWSERHPDLPFQRELEFIPKRKFRADFAEREAKVAIEIQGGTWSRGKSGHNSGTGIERDATKLCLASLSGWVIFPLTERMIADDALLDGIADFIRKRNGQVLGGGD